MEWSGVQGSKVDLSRNTEWSEMACVAYLLGVERKVGQHSADVKHHFNSSVLREVAVSARTVPCGGE